MDNRLVLTVLFVTLSWISSGTNAAPNATATAAPTAVATAAPPLVTNIPVVPLPAAINNTGCGSQQLCASEPSECNPSSGSCFFLSAKQSGNNFDFGLSGESAGYISATLSTDSTLGGNDPTYVCANDNGVVKFFSTFLGDNGQLTMATLSVNTVRGRVNGSTIQCTFAATILTANTRATPVTLSVGTGAFDSNTGALGAPSAQLRSNVANLANPKTNVINLITSNTIALQQSLTQVLLITMGLLGLAAL